MVRAVKIDDGPGMGYWARGNQGSGAWVDWAGNSGGRLGAHHGAEGAEMGTGAAGGAEDIRSGLCGSGVRGRGILFHQRPGIHLTRV